MIDARDLQGRLAGRGYPLAIDGQAGPKTFASTFAFVGKKPVTPLIAALGAAAARWLPSADVTSGRRLRHALAQWAVETGGFGKLEENLNYSAKRLTQVWPGRFPTLTAAQPYANNPRALANKTYGGRMGNTGPDDGWLYRGRGPGMLTGKANYAEAAKLTGLDLIGNPDQAAEPDTGLRVACAYWKSRNVNAAADREDARAVRELVNGGLIGIDEALAFLARARLVLP